MADETSREVFRTLREDQRKYTYFLLAAAGAAIGLAVNQTQGSAISCSQVPLAIAVIAWGLSFFFGCRHLAYVSSNLYANAELLKVESGKHPQVGNHPQMIQAASAGIREAFNENSNRANRLGHLQFRFLIGGAVSYVIWHVFEMYLRLHST